MDRFLDPGVLSGGQLTHGRFRWKICSAGPSVVFFLSPFLEEKIKQESESQTDTYKVKVSGYYADGAVSY